MKKIYTMKEMEKMGLKPKRFSPTISGVKRAGRILINNSDFSSGIRAYDGPHTVDDFTIIEE